MGFFQAENFSCSLVKTGVEVLKSNPELLEEHNCRWSDLMHLEEFIDAVGCGNTYHGFIATFSHLLVQIPDPAEDDGVKTIGIPYALLGLAYSLGFAAKHESETSLLP